MQKTPVEYAKEIEYYKKRINKGLDMTDDLVVEYASAEVEYDKALACEMIKLEHNDVPVTTREKLAKGTNNVAEAKMRWILADKRLKAHFDKLGHLNGCMNATQSQNRYLTGA